jgi:hypothetical protein
MFCLFTPIIEKYRFSRNCTSTHRLSRYTCKYFINFWVWILYTHAWVWVYSVPFVWTWRFAQETAGWTFSTPFINFPVASQLLFLWFFHRASRCLRVGSVHVGESAPRTRATRWLCPNIGRAPVLQSPNLFRWFLDFLPLANVREFTPASHLPRTRRLLRRLPRRREAWNRAISTALTQDSSCSPRRPSSPFLLEAAESHTAPLGGLRVPLHQAWPSAICPKIRHLTPGGDHATFVAEKQLLAREGRRLGREATLRWFRRS